MIKCETCGTEITKENFWTHKHRGFIDGDK